MKAPALKLIAMLLIAACAHINSATAQTPQQEEPQKGCLDVKIISAVHLYGVWQVRFTNPPAGMPASAEMMLEKHEEFGDSLSGAIQRESVTTVGHAGKAAIAGDVDEGVLVLDESSDGVSISAVWNGELVPARCGHEVKGVWKDTSASAPPNAPDVAFTMVKRPGW